MSANRSWHIITMVWNNPTGPPPSMQISRDDRLFLVTALTMPQLLFTWKLRLRSVQRTQKGPAAHVVMLQVDCSLLFFQNKQFGCKKDCGVSCRFVCLCPYQRIFGSKTRTSKDPHTAPIRNLCLLLWCQQTRQGRWALIGLAMPHDCQFLSLIECQMS